MQLRHLGGSKYKRYIPNHKKVQSCISPYFKLKYTLCIPYNYTWTTASKFFNYKKPLECLHRCLRTGPTTPHHQVSRPPGLYLVFPLNYPCHIYNLIYTFIALFFSQPSQTRGAFIKGLGVIGPLFLHA